MPIDKRILFYADSARIAVQSRSQPTRKTNRLHIVLMDVTYQALPTQFLKYKLLRCLGRFSRISIPFICFPKQPT